MNELIEKLSDVALQYADSNTVMGTGGDGSHLTKYGNKLAELIIKECTNAIPLDMDTREYKKTVRRIKAHFGVK